jgi:hypothetical protein
MTSAANERPGRTRGVRAVALVALASLSCTTVRVPASGIPPSVTIRGDVAEPQVELWIESGEEVSPQEAAGAAADARAALQQALAGRNLGAGEQLLVVRAQGVSRTRSRRADQRAAVAGIVVGAVAVVAIVVVVLVATQGKGGGGGRAPAARPAPAPGVRPAPAPGTVAVRPAPVPLPRAAPPPAAPAVRPSGAPGHGGVPMGFGADVQIVVPTPNGLPPPAVWSDSVVTAPPPSREPAVTEVVLPPPPPLEVGRRGFFDEDSMRLELTLVDRATGAPLWVKTVEEEIDPRDAGAVRALLDGALDAPGGWEPARPSP